MADHRVIRCLHEGFTLKRLLVDVDPRTPGNHDLRLAFKRQQLRKWLREVIASRRNVLRFGGAR
jgi:hypothetical protein